MSTQCLFITCGLQMIFKYFEHVLWLRKLFSHLFDFQICFVEYIMLLYIFLMTMFSIFKIPNSILHTRM